MDVNIQLGNKSISKRNENDRDLGAIGNKQPGRV